MKEKTAFLSIANNLSLSIESKILKESIFFQIQRMLCLRGNYLYTCNIQVVKLNKVNVKAIGIKTKLKLVIIISLIIPITYFPQMQDGGWGVKINE